MIYRPCSSQDLIHCDTGYKSLAALKVKVPFFLVCLFYICVGNKKCNFFNVS